MINIESGSIYVSFIGYVIDQFQEWSPILHVKENP